MLQYQKSLKRNNKTNLLIIAYVSQERKERLKINSRYLARRKYWGIKERRFVKCSLEDFSN